MAQYFKPSVLIADSNDTVESSLARMNEAQVGSILVVKDSTIIGIFTERDVLKNWSNLCRSSFKSSPISAVMSSPVHSINVRELHKAGEVMTARRIRHLPVVDDETRLLGILSIRDVLADFVAREGKSTTRKKRPPSKNEVVLHLLMPTEGLESILADITPPNWSQKKWPDFDEWLHSPTFREEVKNAHHAVFADLDGIPLSSRKKLLRELFSLSQGEAAPCIFLCLSRSLLTQSELSALHEIASKTHWHVFERPIALAPLVAEFEDMAGHEQAKSDAQ